jgi:hypothetical protein
MAKLVRESTVDGHLIWHDGSTEDREACLIYQSTAQAVTSQTFTLINMNTVSFDKLNGWDSVNGKYLIQKGGIYLVIGAINWRNVTDGCRSVLELRKNGISFAWINQEHAGAGKDFSSIGNCVLECVAGDDLSLHVWHDAPTSMDTSVIAAGAGVSSSTFFNISKFA